jgi:heme-degrading monooxygenase HmoA
MIRSVLTLTPKPGQHERLMAYYERQGILRRAVQSTGCRSAEIQLRLPEHDSVVVSAVWATREDYTSWVQSGDRAGDVEELLTLLEGNRTDLDAADVYEVVDAVNADRGEAGKA